MAKLRKYQDQNFGAPDRFTRYEFPKLLDESRVALAKLVNAPVETVVFVQNATLGVNVVLNNMVWDDDGKDEIIFFSVIYGGCGKTIDFMIDRSKGLVSKREIEIVYPLEDEEIVARFRAAIEASRAEGKRPKIALYDTVVSQPGVCFPYEEITKACHELGVLSLIDGAQGFGMIPLDLTKLDPDFFTSNCHKWLHVPRSCAGLYIPVRNQHLIVSTMPTSHGYVPKAGARWNPLPQDPNKSPFVRNFQFVGTLENSPYATVKDSIEWREKFLGGEERIMAYLWKLTKEGGKKTADILGTGLIENSKGTLTNNGMANVYLPVKMTGGIDKAYNESGTTFIPEKDAQKFVAWVLARQMDEYKTFIPLIQHGGKYYARLSAQVYLDVDDFEWAGRMLKDLCERAGRNEYQ